MTQIIETAEQTLIHTYNRYQIVLDHGDGVYLYDENGKRYLDCASGIGVFALGYQNPYFNEKMKEQLDKLTHCSNLYYNAPATKAATKLVAASGMEKVFFTNSGTEAIEGAVKIAKKYGYLKFGTTDGEIIAMRHSFHGRSMGALAVTGQPKYQEAFGTVIDNIKFAEYNNLDSVKELITDKTVAILFETVQGEGGLYPGTEEFVKGVRELCDQHDLLMMVDEIQCGMGRTGTMFAYQGFDVVPDVVTSAKAIGNGFPVGAFMVRGKASDVLVAGDHGSTYGGNPLAGMAVDTVLTIFEQDKVVEHVKEVAPYFEKVLDEFVAKYDCILERRGKGLMQGLEFKQPVAPVIAKAQENGLLVISAGANVLRFLPPLIITKEQMDEMAEILHGCIEK